ncbi:MAG TPA: phage antirepressor KilAC domain-containing protein [Azospirillum sp.]|nr:phage antirepressor KilAC domain-containing protein [Azospirillum sp.]
MTSVSPASVERIGNLIPYSFEGATFRVVNRNGAPEFVAADACAILDLGNVSMAVAKLDEDEKGISSVETLGGVQDMLTVTEGGLYTLILRCRGATTPGTTPHRFRKWVTGEVLPSIRKTGSYGAPDPMALLSDAAAMRGLILTYCEKVLALEATVQQQAPAVAALDRLATPTEGASCITDTAKDLQVKPSELTKLLEQHRWIYRRAGSRRRMVAFQDKIRAGLLEHKLKDVDLPDGSTKLTEQVMVTPKGRAKLATMLGTEGRA